MVHVHSQQDARQRPVIGTGSPVQYAKKSCVRSGSTGSRPGIASVTLRPARVDGVGEALPPETAGSALIHQKQVCGRAAINGEAVFRSQHLSIVDSLGAF